MTVTKDREDATSYLSFSSLPYIASQARFERQCLDVVYKYLAHRAYVTVWSLSYLNIGWCITLGEMILLILH
jgi:hypothetical protein